MVGHHRLGSKQSRNLNLPILTRRAHPAIGLPIPTRTSEHLYLLIFFLSLAGLGQRGTQANSESRYLDPKFTLSSRFLTTLALPLLLKARSLPYDGSHAVSRTGVSIISCCSQTGSVTKCAATRGTVSWPLLIFHRQFCCTTAT